MEGLDLSQRSAAFLWVRNGLGLLERFVARADGLGEPVLIEFGRLRLPPARGDVFGGDGDGLEARFREGERRGRRPQRLETEEVIENIRLLRCWRGRRPRLCRSRRRCRGRHLDRVAGLQCLGWAINHPILRGKACRHLDGVAKIPAELD